MSGTAPDLRARLDDRIAAWDVIVDRVVETEYAMLAFGRRGDQPVVVKVARHPDEERRTGEILDAFDGQGVVRAYAYGEGAVLLERLMPGESLDTIAVSGKDDEATRILAATIRSMSPRVPTVAVATAADWGGAFDRYPAGGETPIPASLIGGARRAYAVLCRSQTRARLLHGDLHHQNVLFDAGRGWLAIDPKGVIGEPEYEAGAMLRNPIGHPELFTDPAIVRRRVGCLARELHLDPTRIVAWAFAQAVLAAVWAVEDGVAVRPDHPWLALAHVLRQELDQRAPGAL